MKNLAILISLVVLAGCGGAGKTAMDTGKELINSPVCRTISGEPPRTPQEGTSQRQWPERRPVMAIRQDVLDFWFRPDAGKLVP